MLYVLEAKELSSPRTKIGLVRSVNAGTLYKRIRNLRTGSPVPLMLQFYCEGDLRLERELHKQFALRQVGTSEWFNVHYSEVIKYLMSKQKFNKSEAILYLINTKDNHNGS